MEALADVAVDVEGDADGSVPEPFLHHLRMHPADKARVAQEWRRSCSRIGGSPAFAACSPKVRKNRSG